MVVLAPCFQLAFKAVQYQYKISCEKNTTKNAPFSEVNSSRHQMTWTERPRRSTLVELVPRARAEYGQLSPLPGSNGRSTWGPNAASPGHCTESVAESIKRSAVPKIEAAASSTYKDRGCTGKIYKNLLHWKSHTHSTRFLNIKRNKHHLVSEEL
jgi:hypothetical protein